MVAALSLLSLCFLPGLVSAQYALVKEYAGPSFFDEWDFYGHWDNLTGGATNWLSASDAKSQRLAYVDTVTGNAIIKADNTTQVPWNGKRNAVRMTSQQEFGIGSVWIADFLHVPYGCSVWSAFWSQAPNWPAGGEIDTFEAINRAPSNQFALHTNPGCTITNAVQTSTIVNSTDCSYTSNFNEGCVTTNPDPRSYGEQFSSNGGGVFVTEFAQSAISIWFFSRNEVPSSLQGNVTSVNATALGKPTANYPSGTSCSFDKFFAAQKLVFDITFCGDLAGDVPGTAGKFNETCPGSCQDSWVYGPPANYSTAYFEVQSVRVFSTSDANSTTTTSSNGTTASSTGTAAGSSSTAPNAAFAGATASMFHALAAVIAIAMMLV